MRGKTWILATAVVASLSVAAPARAVDISYATGTGSAGPASGGSVQANCSGLDSAVGGGSYSSGGYGSTFVNALELGDGGIRDHFQAWSYGYESVTLTAVVACVPPSAATGVRYKTKQQKVAGGAAKSLEVHCPSGFAVVGGEVTHDQAAGRMVLQRSRPTAKNTAWEGRLDNITGGKQTMFVTAVCASGKLAKKLTYLKDSETAQGTEVALAVSACGAGQEVVSGGVTVKKNAEVNSTGVQSSGSGSASYVEARGIDARFTNYAVCHG